MLSENYLKTFPPLPASQHFLFSLLTRLYVNVEQVASRFNNLKCGVDGFDRARLWHSTELNRANYDRWQTGMSAPPE